MRRPDVTVIIPTIGDERRGETIWRAIESAGPRPGAATRIIVVINGTQFSADPLAQIRATPTIECVCLQAGSLPLARLTGLQMVASEFFAFLDDDDEFLENGLKPRLDVLRSDAEIAFVVSNGWVTDSGEER